MGAPPTERAVGLLRAGAGRRAKSPLLKTHPLPTLGCKDLAQGQLLKELMQTPNFRVTVVQEVDTVEICGALKVRGCRGGSGVEGRSRRGPRSAGQGCSFFRLLFAGSCSSHRGRTTEARPGSHRPASDSASHWAPFFLSPLAPVGHPSPGSKGWSGGGGGCPGEGSTQANGR